MVNISLIGETSIPARSSQQFRKAPVGAFVKAVQKNKFRRMTSHYAQAKRHTASQRNSPRIALRSTDKNGIVSLVFSTPLVHCTAVTFRYIC